MASLRRCPAPDTVIYVGGIHEKISESLLLDSFSECGQVVNVHIPVNTTTEVHKGYGFIEFNRRKEAEKAIVEKNGSKLMGKTITVLYGYEQYGSSDIGANLFIGNLDPSVNEKLLYDTFSEYGIMLKPPTCARNPQSGLCKGFAFIHYATFEAADAAILNMNKKSLGRRCINVSYAFIKGSREQHGSSDERNLAAQHAMPPPEAPTNSSPSDSFDYDKPQYFDSLSESIDSLVCEPKDDDTQFEADLDPWDYSSPPLVASYCPPPPVMQYPPMYSSQYCDYVPKSSCLCCQNLPQFYAYPQAYAPYYPYNPYANPQNYFLVSKSKTPEKN